MPSRRTLSRRNSARLRREARTRRLANRRARANSSNPPPVEIDPGRSRGNKKIIGEASSTSVRTTRNDQGFRTDVTSNLGNRTGRASSQTADVLTSQQNRALINRAQSSRSLRGQRNQGLSASQVTAMIKKQADEQAKIKAKEDFFNNKGQDQASFDSGQIQAQQDTGTTNQAVVQTGQAQTQIIPQNTADNTVASSPEFGSAVNDFVGSSPGKTLDFQSKKLMDGARRIISRARLAGKDPSEQLSRLFERPEFQVSNKGLKTNQLSNVVDTKAGAIDLSATARDTKSTKSVLEGYLNADKHVDYQKILDDPTAFNKLTSSDLVMLKLGITKDTIDSNAIDTLNSLLSVATRINTYSDQAKGVINASEEADIKLLNAKSIKAQARIDLQRMKLLAQKDSTLRPLRERNARLEGYLKVKMNLNGLSSSASGLSLMMSELNAFSELVANTELKFSNAEKDLLLSGEEIMLDYASQIIATKKQADVNRLSIEEALTNNLIAIEKDRLNANTDRRVLTTEAIGQAIQEKQTIENNRKAQEIEIWKENNRVIESNKLIAIKKVANEIAKQKLKKAEEESGRNIGGIATPKGNVYEWDFVRGGGIEIKAKEGDKGGQCGKFVNDILGGKIFGNSLEQKIGKINSKVPIAGSAVVMDIGSQIYNGKRTGHVAYIEKVNNDGSIQIVESNLGNDEKISRRTIYKNTKEYNAIAGYYIPEDSISELDVYISQIETGSISSDGKTKAIKLARKSGRLVDLNNAINDPKNKPISDDVAEKNNVEAGITQRELNETISQRQQLGFGNAKFQSLPAKDFSAIQGYVETGVLLKELKQKWAEFTDGGGLFDLSFGAGLSGLIDYPRRIGGELLSQAGFTTRRKKLLIDINRISRKQLTELVKRVSGVAVSEQEYKRLSELLPNTNIGTTDAEFEQSLKASIEAYERSAERNVTRFGFSSREEMEKAMMNFGNMPRSKSVIPYDPSDIINNEDIISVLGDQDFPSGIDPDITSRYTQSDS